MKFRKLVFECGIIAASAVIISGSSAVSVSAAEAVSETVNTDSGQDETDSSGTKQDDTKDAAADSDTQEAGKEVTDEESSEEDGSDAEASEWDNKLLVIVEEDSSLSIRGEASTEAEIVGKMYRGSAAEVVEKGDEWSKIVSGDVEGYVKNEYCVFGEEAGAQAQEICDTAATVTADGVRLRSEASTESTIYSVLEEGDSLVVAKDVDETDDGWVEVEYGDETAYVSSEYVDVNLEVGEAVSMEEIYEQQAAEAARKAAEAAAAAAASSAASSGSTASSSGASSSGTSSSGTAVSSSADDATLLAALIQCEAGGESYEGQLAVGAVVINRVKSSSFPNSVSGVIYQSGQFSPASSGRLASVLSSGSISSSCYQAARAAISGEDNTGGAKYFHAGSGSGTVIGNQVFY